MNTDYMDLKGLEQVAGYAKLEGLWLHQVAKIEESRDKAASRGNESAWRYWAGIEKGFKLAMTARRRAIVDIESKDEDAVDVSRIDKILEEMKLKGDAAQ